MPNYPSSTIKPVNLVETAQFDGLAHQHYENFPVTFLFFPRRINRALRIIYAFARIADDVADEAGYQAPERRRLIGLMHEQLLSSIKIGRSGIELFDRLAETIAEFQLHPAYFLDLLSAFEQDIDHRSFKTIQELDDYCSRSANPVGRIMLQLFAQHNPATCAYSDSICTGLQLTNILQDWQTDLARGRLYLPLTELQELSIDPSQLTAAPISGLHPVLLDRQIRRCRSLLKAGLPLAGAVPWRLSLYVRVTVHGALLLLDKIAKREPGEQRRTIRLNKADVLRVVAKCLLSRGAPAIN